MMKVAAEYYLLSRLMSHFMNRGGTVHSGHNEDFDLPRAIYFPFGTCKGQSLQSVPATWHRMKGSAQYCPQSLLARVMSGVRGYVIFPMQYLLTFVLYKGESSDKQCLPGTSFESDLY